EEEQDQSYITAPKNEKPTLKESKNKIKDKKQRQRIMRILKEGARPELYNSAKEQSQCLKRHHQCRMRYKANVEYESQRRMQKCRIRKPTRDVKPTLIKPKEDKVKAKHQKEEFNMTRFTTESLALALVILSPICFLATATLQQLSIIDDFLLPFLQNYFKIKDIPFVMIGVVFVWTYVITAFISVIAQSVGLKNGYDNSEPRLYKGLLRGALARMVAAHQVALENAPAFFAAVIVASANKVPLKYRTSFSIMYTFLRMIHTPLYVLDFDIARAIVHIMALSCTAWLFAFALLPGFEKNYSSIIEVVTILRSVSDDSTWT
ncbi:15739_t:CDS:2, partial [Gigaspora margarita]